MPLTPQEKLLLRIAHHETPETLAALTPEAFAKDRAQDKAAFEDFFPTPPPTKYSNLISQAEPPPPVPSRIPITKPGASK